jgi:hypothetical protein
MLRYPIESAAMKTATLLVSASFLLTTSVLAQTRPATSAPPPPGINDPGVKATVPAATASAASGSLDLKPQSLPSMRDDGVVQNKRDNSIPDVQVHQRGDNTVEEYRRNGQVYMIVVTPKSGIQQTYMVDPQGRVVDEHGQKPARPVMYKVLEWGRAKPAEAASTDDAPDDSGH